MKLIIFGATGSVGMPLVQQALELGHEVTAFVRPESDKFAEIKHKNLRIFKGDVLDLNVVEKAVEGQEVVFCVLGAGSKGIVRAQGTRNIILAMEKMGVRRLICQSTMGAGDSWANLNFFWKRVMFGWLLKKAFEDHQLQETYVKNSSLDWTLVRPGAFTHGPMTAHFKHGFAPHEKSQMKISRADVAHFLLMQLDSEQYIRKTPALSY